MSSTDSESDSQYTSAETNTQITKPRPRRTWTKEEDEKLRLLVSHWGDQGGRRNNWEKIAEQFENRSSKDCRKRWIRSLDPKVRHGKWNSNEDKILKEAFERLGPSWQRIAQLIPGRTDDQCAKRYSDVLDPSVQDRLRPWDPVEDEKLLSLYAKHGSRWQLISKELQGRTGLTCRNRYRKLIRPPKSSSKQSSAQPVSPKPSNNDIPLVMPLQDDSMPFEVPGSTSITGYPAGADAPWILSNGGTTDTGPQSRGHQKNYTITINESNSVPSNLFNQVHYSISDLHLEKILEHASRHGQQIVIHQHVYNVNPMQTQQPLQPQHTQPQPQPQPQSQPQPHTLPQSTNGQPHPSSYNPLHVTGGLPSHPNNIHGLQQPVRNSGDEYIPGFSMRPPLPPPQPVLDESHLRARDLHYERPVAPSLSPSNTRMQPPDEYLGNDDMIFDGPYPGASVPNFDDESIDFMAFNPS